MHSGIDESLQFLATFDALTAEQLQRFLQSGKDQSARLESDDAEFAELTWTALLSDGETRVVLANPILQGESFLSPFNVLSTPPPTSSTTSATPSRFLRLPMRSVPFSHELKHLMVHTEGQSNNYLGRYIDIPSNFFRETDCESDCEFLSRYLGSSHPVLPCSLEVRKLYVRAVISARLNETQVQMHYIRQGVSLVAPSSVTETDLIFQERLLHARRQTTKHYQDSIIRLKENRSPLFIRVSDSSSLIALHMLSALEVEQLVCGQRHVIGEAAVKKLLNVITISGVSGTLASVSNKAVPELPPVIDYLRQMLLEFSPLERSEFLKFVTASSRLPFEVEGKESVEKSYIKVLVQRDKHDIFLPSSATCFRQLFLPAYSSLDVLTRQMKIALESSPGMYR